MVNLLSHRRSKTDGGGGGLTGSSSHNAVHSRRNSCNGGGSTSPLAGPTPSPSLLVDPVLAEAMARAIKAMQKPSKLSSNHFEAALGIAAIGANSFEEQAFLISNSGADRKFCASVISKWAESCRTTSKKATPPLPSKVVADLLRKAAGPLSRRACPGQSDAIERQLELGLQQRQQQGREEVSGLASGEKDAAQALGRHFHTLSSALLSTLRGHGWEHGNGHGWEHGNGNIGDRSTGNDASTSRSCNWWTGGGETRPAAAVPTGSTIFSYSTANASSFSASFTISTPSSSSSSGSSSSHSPATTATPSSGGSFASLVDCRHPQRGYHGGRALHPPRLFISKNSVSRLLARAVTAETESSMSTASLERLTDQLRERTQQLKASESRAVAYASELDRVGGQLAAVEEEAAIYKEYLKEACSYIRELAAEKENTDKLVAACYARVKGLEANLTAAVLKVERGGGFGAANSAAAASDSDAFHDSTEAEGKKAANEENACVRDVAVRIAVRADVSSARRRAQRGDAASRSDQAHSVALEERKAALHETFSALARKAGVDASAVRAEVLSDIAAARRAKASAGAASDPGCRGSSSAGLDGDVGVGQGMSSTAAVDARGGSGSREDGDAGTSPRLAVDADPEQFEGQKTGDAPDLQRCDSQSSLFLSPPSLHGTPANSPKGGVVSGRVSKRTDSDGEVGDGTFDPRAVFASQLSTDDGRDVPSAASGDVKRPPSKRNSWKLGPSITERLRAAAAGPATKLTATVRRGLEATPLESSKPAVEVFGASEEEKDPAVLLESPHSGAVARAALAKDAPKDKTSPWAKATKKNFFRGHFFRHSLHFGIATDDANDGDVSTTGRTANGESPAAGGGDRKTVPDNKEERVRSLFLDRHELGFLKDFGVPPGSGKIAAGERVGGGVFGEVFFLAFEDPDQQSAVCNFTKGGGIVAKRVYKNATAFGYSSFAREVEIVSSFSPGCHENILMYLSVNPRAIVMEAMSSDLQALLIDKRKLTAVPRTQRMRLVANAVRGLSYLHKRAGITHGDVKAANMMVDGSCSVLKLCDFGMAGRSHKDKATGYTPLYAAPEVVSGFMTASPAVVRPSMDTYSVGLVALQVLDVADEPRTSRFADELDAQPAKLCDLRDTLLEPWLWDARGGLCFEEEVTKLMMAWLSKFPFHRPPLDTLEKALQNEKLWSRASPEQQRRKLEQRRQDELEMW